MQANTLLKSYSSLDDLSEAARGLFVDIAAASIRERGIFLVALCGGSTPMRLFEKLSREDLDWSSVHFFWGDERCVPIDDAGSSYGQAKRIWFDKIGPTHVHRIRSELGPAEAATAYAATLKEFATAPLDWPRFDLVLLGMGEDGHTASLFPGSPVEASAPTLAVVANYQDRPANRVTLTQIVFNDARNIFFLAAGAAKAETLKKVIAGKYQPELLPAQRINPEQGQVTWLVDAAAASLL